MIGYAGPRFNSWIDVQSTVLHPRTMDAANNLTEHREVSYRISSEPHVITLLRGHYNSPLKKMYYGKTVSLGIVIHQVDDNVLAHRDIHYRPRERMISTAIITHVDSLISHYHRKNSGVSCPARSGPTVWRTQDEKMERISSGEKPYYNYDHSQSGEHSFRGS